MSETTGLSKADVMNLFAPKAIDPPLKSDRFRGIAVVTDNLQLTIGDFARFFGVDDWKIHTLTSGDNLAVEFGGKPVDAKFRLGLCKHNGVMFEIWQPVSGTTLFSAFQTARQGKGAHDFTVATWQPDEVADKLKALFREGIEPTQKITINGNVDLIYLDTHADLATASKVLVSRGAPMESLADLQGGEDYQAGINTNAAHFPLDKLYHFCVVVQHGRRLAVREGYERLIGIHEWFQLDSETGVTAKDCKHLGKEGYWRFKTASGRRAAFCIEICEQLYGASGYNDMSDKEGEGIHHIMTAFCDKETVAKVYGTLADDNYYEVQSGVTGPIYYCYLRSTKTMGGLAVEAVCPETGEWDEIMTGYMGWLLYGPNEPGYRNPPIVENSRVEYENH